MAKTIAEQISSTEEEIANLDAEVKSLQEVVQEEDRDLTVEESENAETLVKTIEDKERALKGLKTIEKNMMRKAASKAEASGKSFASPKSTFTSDQKKDLLVNMAIVKMKSFVDRLPEAQAIEKYYGDKPEMADIMTKTLVNPADTTTAGWAAELVDQTIGGFLDDLTGDSVYNALRSRGISIPFDGNGSVSIPSWDASSDISGSFVSEGSPIPVKRGTITSQQLFPYKMAVISTFTRELMERSVPSIDGLIRRKISDDTSLAIDTHLLTGGAMVPGESPASPFNGADNQASAGATLENKVTDLTWLLNNLISKNAGRSPVFIMSKSNALALSMTVDGLGNIPTFLSNVSLEGGSAMGIPIITSTHVGNTTVYIMDAADFATAFGVPMFDVSASATLVEANDDGNAPEVGPVGDVARDPAGAPIRSLYQTDSHAVRMRLPLAYASVRNTTAYITGVAWAA